MISTGFSSRDVKRYGKETIDVMKSTGNGSNNGSSREVNKTVGHSRCARRLACLLFLHMCVFDLIDSLPPPPLLHRTSFHWVNTLNERGSCGAHEEFICKNNHVRSSSFLLFAREREQLNHPLARRHHSRVMLLSNELRAMANA